jgi:hypothetical protein
MPSAIRSDEIAEMVEWLSPVMPAISVREAPPARRTADSTMVRFCLGADRHVACPWSC